MKHNKAKSKTFILLQFKYYIFNKKESNLFSYRLAYHHTITFQVLRHVTKHLVSSVMYCLRLSYIYRKLISLLIVGHSGQINQQNYTCVFGYCISFHYDYL